MSTPCCLNCTWFRYEVPYCTCPYEPPECEWAQITVQDRIQTTGTSIPRSDRTFIGEKRMRKRTPQDIADFFGCYVAQNRNGAWFGFPEKPDRYGDSWRIGTRNGIFYIMESLLDIPADHDWTQLYEPQKITSESGIINEESGRNCQNPDLYTCQSEVHTHKEYRVICADNQEKLQGKVTLAINEGWKCQGGVYVQDRSHIAHVNSAFFYQAMVRGA